MRVNALLIIGPLQSCKTFPMMLIDDDDDDEEAMCNLGNKLQPEGILGN